MLVRCFRVNALFRVFRHYPQLTRPRRYCIMHTNVEAGMFQKTNTIFLIAFLFSAVCATAQTATATLSGTVRDPGGLVVPDAQLTLLLTTTGATRTATSDAQGRYSFPALDPGTYELRAEMKGFKTVALRGVVVTGGGSAGADVSLPLGNVSESVAGASRGQFIEPRRVEVRRAAASRETR